MAIRISHRQSRRQLECQERREALPSNSTIATVTDPETAAGSLTVTVTSANPWNGVDDLRNIANTTGTITADIVAASGATNATFTLQVSDGTATATATLNVTVSAASPGNGQGNGDGVTVRSSLDEIGPGELLRSPIT
jgi:uncharacterized protein (DUF3084 family)